MPQKPTDRRRSLVAAAAAIFVVLWILSLRAIATGQEAAGRALPPGDPAALMPFIVPLGQRSLLAQADSDTMVVQRDPFVSPTIVRSNRSAATATGANSPTKDEEPRWVVAAILVEQSRRSALVNDAWVTIGDPLGGGSHLTAVERDHIIVTDARGVRHIVPIQGGEIP
jgi:hypothetical protein